MQLRLHDGHLGLGPVVLTGNHQCYGEAGCQWLWAGIEKKYANTYKFYRDNNNKNNYTTCPQQYIKCPMKESALQKFIQPSTGFAYEPLSWGNTHTWSEMVNLMAVTMVVLIIGESVFRDSCSLGSRADGLMRVSFPKHSATTLRVPSSTHSVCLKSCAHMSLTKPCNTFTPSALLLCRLMIWKRTDIFLNKHQESNWPIYTYIHP